jgi:hypothetical protein
VKKYAREDKQYVRQDKQIRPAGLGLPGDLIDWLKSEAHGEGVPTSRLVAQILEAERKSRQRRRRQRGPMSNMLACLFPFFLNLLP